MSDFSQSGGITTLHRLTGVAGSAPMTWFESLPDRSPVVVVLPVHQRDLGVPALEKILVKLTCCAVIRALILVINGADEATLAEVRGRYGSSNCWIRSGDSARVQRVISESLGVDASMLSGKGLNLWLGMSLVRRHFPEARVLMHDADITSFEMELPARLAFPLLHESLDYQFAKGYYVRYSERLYGRVTRLFVTPLLRALVRVFGHSPFLDYLTSFRYVLAGEQGIGPELLGQIRMPLGWGVELGLLAEAFRHLEPRKICQIDLATNYQHKHQELKPGQSLAGLGRMCQEIGGTLFYEVEREGMRLGESERTALLQSFHRQALEAVRRHHHDAIFNGLDVDPEEETWLAQEFHAALGEALARYPEMRQTPPRVAPPIDALLEKKTALAQWVDDG